MISAELKPYEYFSEAEVECFLDDDALKIRGFARNPKLTKDNSKGFCKYI